MYHNHAQATRPRSPPPPHTMGAACCAGFCTPLETVLDAWWMAEKPALVAAIRAEITADLTAAVTAAMTQLKTDLAPAAPPPAAPPPTVPPLPLTPDGVRERVTRAAARADAT